MATPERQDLLAQIARGVLAPIYCLHGSERFLVERALDAIRAAVLGGEGAGIGSDYDAFDLREVPMARVLAAARTLPMWSKRRLVVGSGIDQVKAEQLEPLVAYVADPNPRGCLVLVGDKVDGRLRAFLALRKAGFLHELARLKDRDLPPWIVAEAKRRRLVIDASAAQALAEAAGPDLGRLVQALEQVALYANGAIRREHVEELIPESRERSVFELTRAIGAGDEALALRLVTAMLRNREPALKIHFMLLRQLRQIWRAKELLAARAPRPEIAVAIGIAPFFLDDVLVPAARMSTAALRRSFLHLYQADRTLKSSRIDPDLQLTRLVRRLAGEAAGR